MAFTAEQQRLNRVKLKARGICTVCHKNETNGKSVCPKCVKRHNKRKKEQRETGLVCHDCCSKLDEFSVAAGVHYCGYCGEKRRINRRRHYVATGR